VKPTLEKNLKENKKVVGTQAGISSSSNRTG
jgi:hypothetical protein